MNSLPLANKTKTHLGREKFPRRKFLGERGGTVAAKNSGTKMSWEQKCLGNKNVLGTKMSWEQKCPGTIVPRAIGSQEVSPRTHLLLGETSWTGISDESLRLQEHRATLGKFAGAHVTVVFCPMRKKLPSRDLKRVWSSNEKWYLRPLRKDFELVIDGKIKQRIERKRKPRRQHRHVKWLRSHKL